METLRIIEELENDTFKLEDGTIVSCDDWNGEKYTRCYYCDEDGYSLRNSDCFEARPIYDMDNENKNYDNYDLVALELWVE